MKNVFVVDVEYGYQKMNEFLFLNVKKHLSWWKTIALMTLYLFWPYFIAS